MNHKCQVCYATTVVMGVTTNGEYHYCSHCQRTDFVPYPTGLMQMAMDATEGPANKLDLDAVKALAAQLETKDQQRLYEALYAWGCRIGR